MPRGSWWPGHKGSHYPAGAKLLGHGTCESGGGSCARGGPRRRRNAGSPEDDRAAGKTGLHSHRGLGLGGRRSRQGLSLEGRGRGAGEGPWGPGGSSCAGSSGLRCRAPPSGRPGPRGRCGRYAGCRERRSGGLDRGRRSPLRPGPLLLLPLLRLEALPAKPPLSGSGWTTRTQHCSGGSCIENELRTKGKDVRWRLEPA